MAVVVMVLLLLLLLRMRNYSRGAPHRSLARSLLLLPACDHLPSLWLPPRPWARALTARLPPRRSFCPTKSLSLAIADNFFITTSNSLPLSAHHQRASHDLLHCIRRYALSSEARKVPTGMSAPFLHSACTLRKMTII